MKGKRNCVAVFVMIAILLLVACSDNVGRNGGEPSAGETPAGTDNNSTPEGKLTISSSIYDRGNVPAAEGTIEENRWTEWISENAPVHVDFVAVPRNESEARLNTLFASGSAPDLLFEYAPAIRNTWYQQRQLVPLDELIEEHSTAYKALLEEYPALRKAGTLDDGQLYYMGKLNEVTPIRAILVRKDWLDKLDLSIPETTEELIEVARAFVQEDPDGNGVKDTYGIAISHQSKMTVDQMFQYNAGMVLQDDETFAYGWNQAVEMTRFKKQLYDEGLVDRDYLNDNNGEKAKQDFITGKLGIYPLLISPRSFAVNELDALRQNVPDAEVIPIAYPESPIGAFNPTFQNPVQMTAAINRGAEHPEAVIQYVDFLIQPETGRTLGYGMEGIHHELDGNGCPYFLDGENRDQVGYMGDALMLMSSSYVTEGICGAESAFNTENPAEQLGLELFQQLKDAYFDLDRPYPELTHSEHMPQLPRDLGITVGETLKSIEDIWVRAIVSGNEYSVEQALQEAQGLWQRGSGSEAEAWMTEWYAENKDTAFLADDIYDIIRQQEGL